MANATSSCFAAIYTSDDAAKTMFDADGRGIHAGMLGPVGTARADDDGFVVTGRYSFGSGCAHATWFGAGTQEVDADGDAVERRVGTARAAGRVPAARAGRVARELGRARPRRHRQLRLLGRRAVRRRRVLVPVADRRAAARRTDVQHRAVRHRRVGPRGLRARCRGARARRAARHRARRSNGWVSSAPCPTSSSSSTTSRCTTPRCARRGRTCSTCSARPRPTALAGGAPVARAAAADAPGDDLRDAGRGRRGPVRVHVGGNERVAQRRTRCSAASATSTRVRSTSTSTTTRSPRTRRRLLSGS